jgi:hypothetical protein
VRQKLKIDLLILSTSSIFIIICGIENRESIADTIILKNGRKVVVDMAWEEGDTIKGKRLTGTIGFPKNEVENVFHEKSEQKDTGSFQFDIWKSGITINEAMKIAKSNDLPIKPVGIINSAVNFKSSIYKYINSVDNFYYKTKLIGKNAEVTLCFTPTSRLLYKLTVHFYNIGAENDEYQDEIKSMLQTKYGKPLKTSKQLFGDSRDWSINNKYTVSMVTVADKINIVYSDNALDNKNTVEKQKKKDKEKSKYHEKDANKF